ncbi:hypothetical protein GGR52DRAFT_202238 [Hypoxylon sp. FL1284]|nr:hypothetical protein GGR52DRAFT_202238 [Hypoxylon sp. FL1284]
MTTTTMDAAAARHVGARLLGGVEEGSLEELLDALRVNLTSGPSNIRPHIPIPALANIASRHHNAAKSAPPPVLSVSGRYLPLLYHLISTLIAEPHNYTVVIVDTESQFDVTRLVGSSSTPANPPSVPSHDSNSSYPATPSDLRHVHVYRPARGAGPSRAAAAAAGEWMVYGAHGSRARAWWGTVVVVGAGAGAAVKGDVNAGWRGWLRVAREDVPGFAAGASVDEALRDRAERQDAADKAGWVAGSRDGAYVWRDG